MSIKYVSSKKTKYCNCVLYARRKAKKYGVKVPYGLWTLWNKKRIINTQKPKEGRVAVMALGFWGHLGMVYKVRGDKIYIVEANYYRCKKSRRKGTRKEFRILGFRK